MNLQLIQIKRLSKRLNACFPRPPLDTDEFNYCAIAIEDGDKYYYWAKGVSIEISKKEFDHVRANPVLYYFSTAARLHQRIEVLRNSGKLSNEGRVGMSPRLKVLEHLMYVLECIKLNTAGQDLLTSKQLLQSEHPRIASLRREVLTLEASDGQKESLLRTMEINRDKFIDGSAIPYKGWSDLESLMHYSPGMALEISLYQISKNHYNPDTGSIG